MGNTHTTDTPRLIHTTNTHRHTNGQDACHTFALAAGARRIRISVERGRGVRLWGTLTTPPVWLCRGVRRMTPLTLDLSHLSTQPRRHKLTEDGIRPCIMPPLGPMACLGQLSRRPATARRHAQSHGEDRPALGGYAGEVRLVHFGSSFQRRAGSRRSRPRSPARHARVHGGILAWSYKSQHSPHAGDHGWEQREHPSPPNAI